MTYRSDLDALEAHHRALEADVATTIRERDAARRMLDDARKRASLPVLDNIQIAAPCSAEWASMTGDERVRHCSSCNKNVYNLSDMTREEAQALLVEREGQLCVRYYRRHDGTILTADCARGKRYRRGRRVLVAGVTTIVLGGMGSCVNKVLSGPFMGKPRMTEPEPVQQPVAPPTR
jgi:hypothetical protein